MSDGGYPVFQVQEPTKEDFYAALADAGLTWEYEDILERHQHPGMRVKEGTIALILHTVRFLESDDSIDVVQVAMVLGPSAAVVARGSKLAEPPLSWRDSAVPVHSGFRRKEL